MRPTPLLVVLIGAGLALGPTQAPPAPRLLQVPSRVRLVLEPRLSDGTAIRPATLADVAAELQRRLNGLGLRAATAESSLGRIVVLASGVRDLQQFEELLTATGGLELHITDGKHRFQDVLPEIDRILEKGTLGRRVTRAPDAVGQLLGQSTRDSTAGALSGTLFTGGVPGEYLVEESLWSYVDSLLRLPVVSAAIPPGVELRWGTQTESRAGRQFRPLYALDSHAVLVAQGITRAVARRDLSSRHAVVVFDLSRRTRRSFCSETGQHIHDYLAILVNNRVQGTPPIINDSICGEAGQIDLQNVPLENARVIAIEMTVGSLPVPLSLVEENVLGPDLGTWNPVVLVVVTVGMIGVVLLVVLSQRRGKSAPSS